METAMLRQILCLSLLPLAFCACGAASDTPAEDGTAPAAVSEAAPASPDGGPVGTISSRGEVVADASGGGGEAPAGSIEFTMRSDWENKPPSSSMRMAQAVIPGPGGAGDFAVFFFGPGGGGGVEDNIQRWIGQMETSDQPR